MAKRRALEVDWHDMEEIPYRASRMFKVLGNPKAYALVRLLLDEDALAVDVIAVKLNRAVWNVSKILRHLREIDVVRYQRKGRSAFYTLKNPARTAEVLSSAEAFISDSLTA